MTRELREGPNREQSRNWVFTLNNPVEGDADILLNLVEAHECGRYIVFQEETGAEGTIHYQGYLELKRGMRRGTLKRKTGFIGGSGNRSIWLGKRRGSQDQCIAYASKDETRTGEHWEKGIKARTSRYKNVAEAALGGDSKRMIMEAFPDDYMKYACNIAKMVDAVTEPRDWAMEIIIYYGKTGTGKSYTAHKNYPDAYHCTWPTGGRWWWPNYDGEETIIMDEFRHQVSMDVLLQLFDRYPLTIECKGGNMKFVSKRIIITTNIEPHKWYPKVTDATMLRRRITEFAKIYEFRPIGWPLDEDGDAIMTEDPIVSKTEVQLKDREPAFDFSTSGRGGLQYGSN